MRSAGEKKCMPTTRSGWRLPLGNLVDRQRRGVGGDDRLGRQRPPRARARRSRLTSRSSKTASMTRSVAAKARVVGRARDALQDLRPSRRWNRRRATPVVDHLANRGQPSGHGLRLDVAQPHAQPGRRANLGDRRAHEPRAHHAHAAPPFAALLSQPDRRSAAGWPGTARSGCSRRGVGGQLAERARLGLQAGRQAVLEAALDGFQRAQRRRDSARGCAPAPPRAPGDTSAARPAASARPRRWPRCTLSPSVSGRSSGRFGLRAHARAA